MLRLGEYRGGKYMWIPDVTKTSPSQPHEQDIFVFWNKIGWFFKFFESVTKKSPMKIRSIDLMGREYFPHALTLT
jgi:hypothetical protein